MQFDLDSVRKILVIRYRSIGDILLSNPTLAALRRRFPGAAIHMLIDDRFVEILRNNPNIDRVVINERRPARPGVRTEWRKIQKLRSEKYDMVVDLQTGPRGALTTLLSGAGIRVGHRFRMRNRLSYNLYAEPPEPEDHSWKVQFRTVRPLGIDWPDRLELFLDIPERAKASMHERLEEAGLMFDRPIVTLHPGARVQVKRWPAVKMGQLARWLVDEKEVAVVLAGSDADAGEIQTIRRVSGYALPFFIDVSLGELGALLETSATLVCNDSGPMHMAGALDTPVVTLFGPSDPTLWAPLGERKVVVSCDPMECMPCDQKNCSFVGEHCMTRIELEEVVMAVERLNALA